MKTELTELARQFRPVTLSYRYSAVDLTPLPALDLPDRDAIAQRQDALIKQLETTSTPYFEQWMAQKAQQTAPGYFQSAKLLVPERATERKSQ